MSSRPGPAALRPRCARGYFAHLSAALLAAATAAAPAWAQSCDARPAGPGALALEAHYGGGDGFRDRGAAGRHRAGPLLLSAGFTARDFSGRSTDLRAYRAGAAVPLPLAGGLTGLTLCPGAGAMRETLGDLSILALPLGAGVSAEVPIGPSARLGAFLHPSLVYSRSSFAAWTRTATDPALEAGGRLGLGPAYLGASWQRRFADGLPGAWHAFLGWQAR